MSMKANILAHELLAGDNVRVVAYNSVRRFRRTVEVASVDRKGKNVDVTDSDGDVWTFGAFDVVELRLR